MYPKGNKNSWNDDSLRVNYNLNEDSIVIDLGLKHFFSQCN